MQGRHQEHLREVQLLYLTGLGLPSERCCRLGEVPSSCRPPHMDEVHDHSIGFKNKFYDVLHAFTLHIPFLSNSAKAQGREKS